MGKANEAASASSRLEGVRVLVVEDDFIIGLDLAAILADAGAEVVGPRQTVEGALLSAEDRGISAAILDIRIGGRTVAPVARRLTALHIPFLFYTGQSQTDPLRAEWPDCRIVSKPALPLSLVSAVAALLANPAQKPRSATRRR